MLKEQFSKEEDIEEGPRSYTHNEIAKICRNCFLRINNVDGIIYNFAEENDGKITTQKELEAKFENTLKKEK